MSYWENLHDWNIDDINFELCQMKEIHLLLIRHPFDSSGEIMREIINNIEKNIKKLCLDYKKIYGVRPNIRKLKLKCGL